MQINEVEVIRIIQESTDGILSMPAAEINQFNEIISPYKLLIRRKHYDIRLII